MHAFPKSEETVSAVIRCRNRNDFYNLLHEIVTCKVVRKPNKKGGDEFSISGSDSDEGENLYRRQWIRYVKRKADPRNDLPFAKIPLFLWYTFMEHSNSVFYCCQRGYLVVESLSEDPRLGSPTRPAVQRIGTFDVVKKTIHHAPSEWDTVKLIVSPSTEHCPPFPEYGACNNATLDATRNVNANLLGQYKDVFLCISDTHVLFINSFGNIRLHFCFDEIVSMTYPKEGLDTATYPFVRFSIKAGADWVEEPPLLLTFTLLPLIPHTQLSASFAIITPKVSGSDSDVGEDTIMELLNYEQQREMNEVYARKDVLVDLFDKLCDKPKVVKTYREFDTVLPLLRDALLSKSEDVAYFLELERMDMSLQTEEDPFPRQYSETGVGKTSHTSSVPGNAYTYEDSQKAELSLRMAVNQIPYITEKSDLFFDEASDEEDLYRKPQKRSNSYYDSNPQRIAREVVSSGEDVMEDDDSCDYAAVRPQRKKSELIRRSSDGE
ncbi:hypothetical protein ADEAN_000099000 [Angomonas deanei]|uniref:Uncharacterized protein n=1 Tax=Angomonas deanei TaxID=59799 RepID=A0A7G2C490_9TRYP|nr:hypothetical protein ADEAN_000099000 [Angomonas deanei]